MINFNNINNYPEGYEYIKNILSALHGAKKEQLILFVMQIDKTFNKARIEKAIETLLKNGLIYIDKDSEIITLEKGLELNQEDIDALWLLLQFVDRDTPFDKANYPASIVFMNDDTVCEIIISSNDLNEKMDYLSKRIKRKNKCHYYILVPDRTLQEVDYDLFPEEKFDLITIKRTESGPPKFIYHDVFIEGNE